MGLQPEADPTPSGGNFEFFRSLVFGLLSSVLIVSNCLLKVNQCDTIPFRTNGHELHTNRHKSIRVYSRVSR